MTRADHDANIPIDPDLDGTVPPRPPSGSGRSYAPFRVDPRPLLAVAAGGALGGPARYGISQALPTTSGTFPWATLGINVSGSFALGFLLVILLERFGPSRYVRAFLGTGFLGAYTTFSTFAVETDLLLRDGQYASATAYVTASIIAGLLAVYVGMTLARLLPPHPVRRL